MLLDSPEGELTDPNDLLDALAGLARALFSPDHIIVAARPREEARSLIEQSPDGIVVLDESAKVASINGAALQVFRQAGADVLGKPATVLLTADGEPPLAISAGADGRMRLVLSPKLLGVRRGGDTLPLEVRVSELSLEGRTLFLLLVRDLEERRRLEAPERKAEARYRALVEQIPAVTFMASLDEGPNAMYVSPQIESLLGFSQQEWVEDPILWYRQLHPDDRALWNGEFARGVETGGPFRAECRVISRSGKVVWIHGEARLVRDDSGRPLFLQGMVFDITESKRAEHEIRDAQEAKVRHERLAALGQVAASIGHDLRNPLGAIRNAWFYIQRRLAGSELVAQDPRVATFGALIERELTRSVSIITDLLDFSRERPLHRVRCPIGPLVNEAFSILELPAGRIQLIDEVPADLPVPYLDRDQFRQAFVNLMQNAVEAVDPAQGVVRVRARAEPDSIVMEFVDNGRGIAPELTDKIFEPLFTTKLRGTGLGLSIIANILRRHGGTIEVVSVPAQGTTFRLRVPLNLAP